MLSLLEASNQGVISADLIISVLEFCKSGLNTFRIVKLKYGISVLICLRVSDQVSFYFCAYHFASNYCSLICVCIVQSQTGVDVLRDITSLHSLISRFPPNPPNFCYLFNLLAYLGFCLLCQGLSLDDQVIRGCLFILESGILKS